NPDGGTEVVARNGDTDPVGIQPLGHMAEEGTVQRLPVAAMNEHHDGATTVAGKEIDPVACTRSIANRTRRVALAIGGRVLGPTGDQRGILRDPRPVVVFDL